MQTRREEILGILKRQGEATVDELAKTLDLTPVTVRHHLDIMRADRLVQSPAVRHRRGPGRPQYVYTLTGDAAEHFPKKYTELVNELLDEMKAKLGEKAVHEILDSIVDHRLDKAPALDPDLPLAERLEKLTAYMTEHGFIAAWEQRDGEWFIHASNCPYLNVAAQHPELCSMDLSLFEQLSGTRIVRLQSIVEGAYSCIYQVVPPPVQGVESPR